MQFQPLGAWKLGLTTSHGVMSMMWMPAWPHFSKVGLGTCVESWIKRKARPSSRHKSRKHICVKESNFDCNDY